MPHPDGTTWRWCASRPRWYRDGGIWATESTVHGSKSNKLVRWKPPIQLICEPLMGKGVIGDDGSRSVKYPSLRECLAIYEEALNLVAVFGERDDLFTLSVYRRQVRTLGSVSLDTRFLALAHRMDLTSSEWARLALRMPARSWILEACLARSSVALLAAE